MHLHDLLGWPGPMTFRQFLAWNEHLAADMNQPSRADYYAMHQTQLLDAIYHWFDKKWENKKLEHYKQEFVKPEPAKVSERKPGKVPYQEGEWWPHPLTKEEVEAGKAAMRRGHAVAQAMGKRA